MATRWPAAVLASGLLLHGASGAAQPETTTDDATTTLLERLAATAEPLTSYRALRTLTAETGGGKMQARLTAWTSLDPIAGFEYSIVDEEGSAVMRQKVLRAALEAERRIRATGTLDKAALTPANYDFADAKPTDDGLAQIGIRPKRSDTMLVDGWIVLTDPGGDLVRVEGVLSKRPSMWTREVRVVRQYARIAGIRVPVEMRSVARVLLVGQSTFSMVYEYASINGLPVNSETTADPR